MEYKTIVLDLLERVMHLEEKVSLLESELNVIGKNEDKLENKITRNGSRKYVIEELIKNNPDFAIEKGNRASKADIIFTKQENEITYNLKAKFYHSRSFKDFPSGWHTVSKDDILNEDINMYIFNIEYQQEFYTFLFSRLDILKFVVNKLKDQNNLYHFYFHVTGGREMEVRDKEKNASKHFNNWTLPSQLLK